MKARRCRRVWRTCGAATLGAMAMVLAPSPVAAAEHVQDGGFEASACDATQCSNPAWPKSSTSAFANSTGPICRAGTGSGNTACSGGGAAAFGGSTWARLGAGYKATNMFGGGIISSLEQAVPIPSAPATLRFRLRIIDALEPVGEFKVELGGAQVFDVTDATTGFAAYTPVTIDVSSQAGTTSLLRLEAFSSQLPVGPLDSFDVDDVSISTVDPVDPRCAKLRSKLKKAKKKKQRRKIRKKIRALGC